MTRYSFNPYHKYGKAFSPISYKELIIEQQRRISELTAAIQQAEQYLEANPGLEPILYRLNSMTRELATVRASLTKSERGLAELLEKMKEGK